MSIDIWNAGINSEVPCSKVCNREDRYAITHARSDTLKSSRDAVNFVVGINFRRKAATRKLFSKRKAFSKYPKISSLQKLPAMRYLNAACFSGSFSAPVISRIESIRGGLVEGGQGWWWGRVGN